MKGIENRFTMGTDENIMFVVGALLNQTLLQLYVKMVPGHFCWFGCGCAGAVLKDISGESNECRLWSC